MAFQRRGKTLEQSLRTIDENVRQAAAKAVSATSQTYVDKYDIVVKEWKNKPLFFFKRTLAKDVIKSIVFIAGTKKAKNVFIWTDEGTEAHIILPVKAPFLRFQTGYSARTAPIAKANLGDGTSSGATVYSKGVIHPGTKARKFSETYAREAVGVLREKLITEIKRVT